MRSSSSVEKRRKRSCANEICGTKKRRKLKSETENSVSAQTQKCDEHGIKQISIAALSLRNENEVILEECIAPWKKTRIGHQKSIENEKAQRDAVGDRFDTSQYKVCFQNIDPGKRDKCERENDLQYEKTLQRTRFWRKFLPCLVGEKLSTEPEDVEKDGRRPLFFVTYAIARDIGLRTAIFLKIRKLLLYIVFMFFLTCSAFGHFSAESYYFTEMVNSVFIKKCVFYNSDGQPGTFEDIHSLNDMQSFVEDCFEPGISRKLWGKVGEDSGIILLTTPRFRQVRVVDRACLISLFGGNVCQDFFSQDSESREPFGSGDPVGFAYFRTEDGDAWTTGYYARYNSNGFAFLTTPNTTYTSLLNQGWVDKATSAVFLDFTLYSTDTNLFNVVQFLFEMPPTGGVRSSHTSRAVYLMRYHSYFGHFLLSAEAMCAFMNLLYSLEAVLNFTYFKYRYFTSFGMLYNLAVTIFCWYALYCLIMRYLAVEAFLGDRFLRDEFVDFQPILAEHVNCDLTIILAFFFASFKLYGYLNFDLMGHLKITLQTCFKNIIVFSIAFTIILWAFVQVANLLFGASLERYRSFSRCFSELMKVMLGDLDYEGPSSILKTIGPIFILIYVLFVVFVFINMFFAIMNGTFTFVSSNIVVEEDSYFGFLAHCWQTIRLKAGKGRAVKVEEKKLKNSERIRNLLLDAGYSNVEIKMFFCRYVVDDAQGLEEAVFENMWNLRIPPERLDQLKALTEELGNTVDLLLFKAEWLFRKIRHIKETRLRRRTDGANL